MSYNGGLNIHTELLNAFLQARPMSVKRRLDQMQPLSVACPTCGAAAGKRCLLSSGGIRNEPHGNRKIKAIEVNEKKTGIRA